MQAMILNSESKSDFKLILDIPNKLDVRATTCSYEKQIDQIDHKLYELTYDEVKIVAPGFELSQAE